METKLKRYTADRIAFNHVYDQLIAQNRLTSSLLYVFIVFETHDFKLPLTCLIKETGLPKQTVTSSQQVEPRRKDRNFSRPDR